MCAASVALTAYVGHAARPRPRATFTPQVPGASRAAGNRVFLEKADVLYKQRTDSFMVVSGNVVFTKGPMTMKCDSAHYFPGVESCVAEGQRSKVQGAPQFL